MKLLCHEVTSVITDVSTNRRLWCHKFCTDNKMDKPPTAVILLEIRLSEPVYVTGAYYEIGLPFGEGGAE